METARRLLVLAVSGHDRERPRTRRVPAFCSLAGSGRTNDDSRRSSVASGMRRGGASPGVRPSQVCEGLTDREAARLLPDGALRLLRALDPDRLSSARRTVTLGEILSLERAVDEPQGREILLGRLSAEKLDELAHRTGSSLDHLLEQEKLEPTVRRQVLGFFGAPMFTGRRSETVDSVQDVAPQRALFPHQKTAASEVERYLYFEEGRVMLHLPTGVGKTRTAMSIVASHLRMRSQSLVLWLAATRELLEQAALEFEATWKTVGDRELPCLRFWSDHNPPLRDASEGFVVAGLGKLHSYGRDRKALWNLGDRTTMVVFDEAHQAVAVTYQDLIDTIVSRNPRTPLLGLSATPGRTWAEPDVDMALAELFHGNKVMIGGANPIRRLTAEGYLAEVDFQRLHVEPSVPLSPADLERLAGAREIPDSLAARLGRDEQRNLLIVGRLRELVKKHNRILVFAASVDSAVLLAAVCRGLGLNADAVTAKTDGAERSHVIRRFRKRGGGTRLLFNYGVLTAGFDAPAASCALIARPTKSLVLYSQMVGRVTRGPRAGGNERCEVVTVVDTTLPGFGSLAEAFTNWEDIWSSE